MVYIDLPPQQPVVEIAQVSAQPSQSQPEGKLTSREVGSELGQLLSGVNQPASVNILDRLSSSANDIDNSSPVNGTATSTPHPQSTSLLAPGAQTALQPPLWAQASSPEQTQQQTVRQTVQQTAQRNMTDADLPRLEGAPAESTGDRTGNGDSLNDPTGGDAAAENPRDTNAPETGTDNRTEDATEETIEIEVESNGDITTEDFVSQLQLTADFQEFDPGTQIITARGNVVLKLNDAIIEANELWLNLVN
ncbi:MAG: hypothetical protein AAFP03_15525, partial [Cyanobacteria bacterium J06598_3]